MALPYKAIPKTQQVYSPGNIIARFIDGLGYRYYWATEGLTETDLAFRPSKDSRSTLETLQHIHGLSEAILNAPKHKANVRPYVTPEHSFKSLRRETLENLQKASTLFQGKSAKEVAGAMVIFEREGQETKFPFWNMINGQLSDAMYHVGQIVSHRRASGHPINPKVNVFLGKTGK